MRSTMAPEISAAVMIANVPWNAMNNRCGIVPWASSPTPRSPTKANPPTIGEPGAKAKEYPASAHSTATGPSDTKLIIIVLSAFFARTIPP